MKKILTVFFLLFFCFLITSCSSEDESSSNAPKKDHVWKEQTETINKAKEVEGIIMDSAEDTRKKIEQQSE